MFAKNQKREKNEIDRHEKEEEEEVKKQLQTRNLSKSTFKLTLSASHPHQCYSAKEKFTMKTHWKLRQNYLKCEREKNIEGI